MVLALLCQYGLDFLYSVSPMCNKDNKWCTKLLFLASRPAEIVLGLEAEFASFSLLN